MSQEGAEKGSFVVCLPACPAAVQRAPGGSLWAPLSEGSRLGSSPERYSQLLWLKSSSQRAGTSSSLTLLPSSCVTSSLDLSFPYL